ncbi:MAG: flagellar motor switch protein FliN [Bryobacteraceae bacterium]
MTDTTDNQIWFVSEFANAFGLVLETMTGARPRVECKAAAETATSSGDLILDLPLNGLADASFCIRASQPNWSAIGSAVLKAAGLDEIDSDTSRSTFVETIGQAAGSVCQALSGRLRREISCATPILSASIAANASWVEVSIAFEEGQTATMYLGFTKALLASIAPADSLAAVPSAAAALSAIGDSGPARTLDLLFDVELPVSVSFGRAQLPLKDVIKLTTGSIVELNRAITEPVEIIVNNCVIARGDVVVVEGNFGVRIQQVISRQERLRTLT